MAHQLLQRQSLHYTLAADSIVRHLQHCSEIQVESSDSGIAINKRKRKKENYCSISILIHGLLKFM